MAGYFPQRAQDTMDQPIMRHYGVFVCRICNTSSFFGERDFAAHVNGVLHETTKARLKYGSAPAQVAQVDQPRVTFDYGHKSSADSADKQMYDYGHSSKHTPAPQVTEQGPSAVVKNKGSKDILNMVPGDDMDEPVLLEDGNYLCKLCNVNMPSVNNVKIHIYGAKHLKMKQYEMIPPEDRPIDLFGGVLKCPRCLGIESGMDNYVDHLCSAQHLMAVDDEKLSTQQKLSGDRYDEPFTLNNLYLCKICDKVKCGSEDQFKIHLTGSQHQVMKKIRLLPIGDRPVSHGKNLHQCPKCALITPSLDSYVEHFDGAQHMAACGQGDATALQKASEDDLDKLVPMDLGRFMCKICNLQGLTPGNIPTHIKGNKHQRMKKLHLIRPEDNPKLLGPAEMQCPHCLHIATNLLEYSEHLTSDKHLLSIGHEETIRRNAEKALEQTKEEEKWLSEVMKLAEPIEHGGYKCKLCYVPSTSKDGYLTHCRGAQHKRRLLYQKDLSSLDSLDKKYVKEESDLLNVTCTLCQTFMQYSCMMAHFNGKQHQGNRMFKTEKQSEIQEEYTEIGVGQLRCKKCGTAIPAMQYKAHLLGKTHRLRVIKSTKPEFYPIMTPGLNILTCPLCKEEHTNIEFYEQHLKSQHPSEGESSKTAQEEASEKHEWAKGDEPIIDQNKYQCRLCSATMWGFSTYMIHTASKKHRRNREAYFAGELILAVHVDPPKEQGSIRNLRNPKLLLMNQLQNCEQKLFGLDHLVEWQLDRKKNPVKYLCQLCKAHPERPLDHLVSPDHVDVYFAKNYPDIYQHIKCMKDPLVRQQLREEYAKGLAQTITLGHPYALLALRETDMEDFRDDPRLVQHHNQNWLCLQFDVKEGVEVAPRATVVLPWKKERVAKKDATETENVPPPPVQQDNQDSAETENVPPPPVQQNNQDVIAASPWVTTDPRPMQETHLVVENQHETFGGMQNLNSEPLQASQATTITGNSFKTFSVDAATQRILGDFLDGMSDNLTTENVVENDIVAVLCGEALTQAPIARICLQLSTAITKALQEYRKSPGQANGPITNAAQAEAAKTIPKALMKSVFLFKKNHPEERLTATVSVKKTVEELNQSKSRAALKRHSDSPQESPAPPESKKSRDSDRHDDKTGKKDNKQGSRRKEESNHRGRQREKGQEASKQDSVMQRKESDINLPPEQDWHGSGSGGGVEMKEDTPASTGDGASRITKALASVFSDNMDRQGFGQIQAILGQIMQERALSGSQVDHIVGAVKEVLQAEGEVNIEQMLARIAPLLLGGQGDTEMTPEGLEPSKPEESTSKKPEESKPKEPVESKSKKLEESQSKKPVESKPTMPVESKPTKSVESKSKKSEESKESEESKPKQSEDLKTNKSSDESTSKKPEVSESLISEDQTATEDMDLGSDPPSPSASQAVHMDVDAAPPSGNALDDLTQLFATYGGDMEEVLSTLVQVIKERSLSESQVAHIVRVVREVLTSNADINMELVMTQITPLLLGNQPDEETKSSLPKDQQQAAEWDLSQPVELRRGMPGNLLIPPAGQAFDSLAGSQLAPQPIPAPTSQSTESTEISAVLGTILDGVNSDTGAMQMAIMQMIEHSSLSESQLEQVIMIVQQVLESTDSLTQEQMVSRISPALMAIMGSDENQLPPTSAATPMLANPVPHSLMIPPPGVPLSTTSSAAPSILQPGSQQALPYPPSTMPPQQEATMPHLGHGMGLYQGDTQHGGTQSLGLPQVSQPPAGLPQVSQSPAGLPQVSQPPASLPQVSQPPAGLQNINLQPVGSQRADEITRIPNMDFAPQAMMNSQPLNPPPGPSYTQESMMPPNFQPSNPPPGASYTQESMMPPNFQPLNPPPRAPMLFPSAAYSSNQIGEQRQTLKKSEKNPEPAQEVGAWARKKALWIGWKSDRKYSKDVRRYLTKAAKVIGPVRSQKGFYMIVMFKSFVDASTSMEMLQVLPDIDVKYYKGKKDEEGLKPVPSERREDNLERRHSGPEKFPFHLDPLRIVIRREANLPVGSSIISEFVPKAIGVDFARDKMGSYAIAEFRHHEDALEAEERLSRGTSGGEILNVNFKRKKNMD